MNDNIELKKLIFVIFLIKNKALDDFLQKCEITSEYIKSTCEEEYLSDAFLWATTKQGWLFWAKLNEKWKQEILK